ncbi:hypothetical protein SNEBB_003628 [Seison nebaliae]|nr:hypothetical protein SNEBB_003628 [Seison nebaliae]
MITENFNLNDIILQQNRSNLMQQSRRGRYNGSHHVKSRSNNLLKEISLCLVCGDRASGKHYGVMSCDGCRGFFKRSVRRSVDYECKENNQCIVDVSRRNQCQACRYRKCLSVSMNKDAVQHERLPKTSSNTTNSNSNGKKKTKTEIINNADHYRQQLLKEQLKNTQSLQQHYLNGVGHPMMYNSFEVNQRIKKLGNVPPPSYSSTPQKNEPMKSIDNQSEMKKEDVLKYLKNIVLLKAFINQNRSSEESNGEDDDQKPSISPSSDENSTNSPPINNKSFNIDSLVSMKNKNKKRRHSSNLSSSSSISSTSSEEGSKRMKIITQFNSNISNDVPKLDSIDVNDSGIQTEIKRSINSHSYQIFLHEILSEINDNYQIPISPTEISIKIQNLLHVIYQTKSSELLSSSNEKINLLSQLVREQNDQNQFLRNLSIILIISNIQIEDQLKKRILQDLCEKNNGHLPLYLQSLCILQC